MTNLELFDKADITSNRHKGNPESNDAFKDVKDRLVGDRVKILNYLKHCHATCKDIAIALNMKYTTVSGRLSELKAMGLVEKTGYRREGSAVLTASKKGRGWENLTSTTTPTEI